jgi:putative ABC transport system permease protein
MNFAREIRLACRLLARDYRAGELALIALAIAIAVASVTTVGFFTSRVQAALDQQANRLLGADLVIADSRPIAAELRAGAEQHGLAAITVLRFPSMAMRGSRSFLSDIKAVEPGYPLRGELRLADRLFGPDRVADAIPQPGEVWVDERLYTSLELTEGDRITLGNREFRVGAIVTHEPGVDFGFLSGAPRVLLNAADIASTGLIGPGSRVRYGLYAAGGEENVARFREWASGRLAPGQRMEGIRDARPELRSALERAERFLNLAALTSVMLAAVAIALATRRYLQRHFDGCAVMRCLGAPQGLITRLYLMHFTILGALAALAGVALGAAAQLALTAWLGQVVAVDLPPAGVLPALHGLLVGMLLLLGFALPPLMNLSQVPTVRVLRRELGMPRGSGAMGYAAGIAIIVGLILWQSHDVRFGLTVLGWLVAAMVADAALGWLLLHVLGKLRGRGVSWRFGIASLQRRMLGTLLQVVALGLGVMALLTLTFIQGDLLRTWQESLPPDAPNRFIINIQRDQVAGIRDFFRSRHLPAPEIFPMVRGRLIRIGDRGVSAENYADERSRRIVTREFNLSWTARPQGDNRVVAGRWWEAGARPDQFSVERGLAERLGIRIGDVLTFDVAGTPVAATVTNLRSVEWDSFNVNFFVVSPPGLLEKFPATYVTSFHLMAGHVELLNALVRAFPNVVLIDIAQALAQVQRMMSQAARAVQFVFLFTLIAGLIVLYAAVASSQDERIYQATLLRTLGASRAQIHRAHVAEFTLIGTVAGVVAAAGSTGLAYFVAHRFLELEYTPDPAVWLVGVLGTAAGVTLAGWLGTRRVLTVPPLHALRSMT